MHKVFSSLHFVFILLSLVLLGMQLVKQESQFSRDGVSSAKLELAKLQRCGVKKQNIVGENSGCEITPNTITTINTSGP